MKIKETFKIPKSNAKCVCFFVKGKTEDLAFFEKGKS
jgi:hypothetical protein